MSTVGQESAGIEDAGTNSNAKQTTESKEGSVKKHEKSSKGYLQIPHKREYD